VEFVRHCASSTGSLDIICRHWAPPPSSVVGLPTWVGSVAGSAFGPLSKFTGRANGDSFVGEAGRRVYNASRARPARVRFSERGTDGWDAGPSPLGSRLELEGLQHCDGGPRYLHAIGFQLSQITRTSSRVIDGTLSDECLKLAGWNPGQDVNNISD